MPFHRVTFVFFALLVATPGFARERVFTVTGVVRAPLDAGRIVVAHQEIPGYMPAMTMGFDVAGSAMMRAAALQPGDRVQFALHVADERALADRFRVIGTGASAGPERAAPIAGLRLEVGDRVPDFALEDQDGQPVTRASLNGHLTLLTFIFTRCPMPQFCPLLTHRFGELQRAIEADPQLARRFQLLSVTLDPDYDRPAVLKSYGEAAGAQPAVWRLATGSAEQIETLVHAFSVYRERNGVLLDHTLCTALVNADGLIVQIWRGNDWTAADVLTVVRQGLAPRPVAPDAPTPGRAG